MIEFTAYFLTQNDHPIGPISLQDDLTAFRFAAEYGLSDTVPGIWVVSKGRSVILVKHRRLIEQRSAAAEIRLAATIHRPIALTPLSGHTVRRHVFDLVQKIREWPSDPNVILRSADYDQHLNCLNRRLLALAAIHDIDLARFGHEIGLSTAPASSTVFTADSER
jgi:hypothetical protein